MTKSNHSSARPRPRKRDHLPKVIKLKAEGLSSREIGRELGLSKSCVNGWLRTIRLQPAAKQPPQLPDPVQAKIAFYESLAVELYEEWRRSKEDKKVRVVEETGPAGDEAAKKKTSIRTETRTGNASLLARSMEAQRMAERLQGTICRAGKRFYPLPGGAGPLAAPLRRRSGKTHHGGSGQGAVGEMAEAVRPAGGLRRRQQGPQRPAGRLFGDCLRGGRRKEGLLFVDAIVERMPLDQIVRKTVVFCDEKKPDMVGIEAEQFQELLVHEFRRQCGTQFSVRWPTYEMVTHGVPKVARIRRLSQYVINRELRFRADSPGCRLLVDQLMDFPLAEHDDGPDALEMCTRLPFEAR